MLKYGFAKAKFTANAIYLQTLAVLAATAVKVAGQKVARQASAVVVTKEAANAVANAEEALMIKEVVEAMIVAVAPVVVEIVRVDKIARVAVPVQIAVVEIARVAQEKDNNQSRDRHRIDNKA